MAGRTKHMIRSHRSKRDYKTHFKVTAQQKKARKGIQKGIQHLLHKMIGNVFLRFFK